MWTREKRMKPSAGRPALLAVLIAFAAAAFADSTAPPAPESQAQIAFANHGGIYDWQVVNDRTLLIQGQNRQWYKATLLSACFELPFTETLGFESNADGSFDKFSSIKVRGQNCPLVSLVETSPPPKKSAPHKPGAATPSTSAPPVEKQG
jgi:Family of unknown function (DUF6491)